MFLWKIPIFELHIFDLEEMFLLVANIKKFTLKNGFCPLNILCKNFESQIFEFFYFEDKYFEFIFE